MAVCRKIGIQVWNCDLWLRVSEGDGKVRLRMKKRRRVKSGLESARFINQVYCDCWSGKRKLVQQNFKALSGVQFGYYWLILGLDERKKLLLLVFAGVEKCRKEFCSLEWIILTQKAWERKGNLTASPSDYIIILMCCESIKWGREQSLCIHRMIGRKQEWNMRGRSCRRTDNMEAIIRFIAWPAFS